MKNTRLGVISKGKNNGNDCWILTITHNGKRRRKFFTGKEALKNAKNFDPIPWLISLVEKEPAGEATKLSVAFDMYLKNVLDRGYGGESLKTYAYRIGRFCAENGGLVSEYNPERVVSWIREQRCSGNGQWRGKEGNLWSNQTRTGYLVDIGVFFRWCARRGLGVRLADWPKGSDRMKIGERVKSYARPIGVLPPDQVHLLLQSSATDFQEGPNHRGTRGQYVPAFAIMFFCGVRAHGEMSRLDYSSIRWGKSIRIPDMVSKTGKTRLLTDLPENLWAWIPKRGGGRIMRSYSGMEQHRKRLCKRLGIGWPPNGARHSFATYGYFRGAEWAMNTMGHRSYDTFHRYYKRDDFSKKDSEEYFSIVP